jgi:hypothetical protein
MGGRSVLEDRKLRQVGPENEVATPPRFDGLGKWVLLPDIEKLRGDTASLFIGIKRLEKDLPSLLAPKEPEYYERGLTRIVSPGSMKFVESEEMRALGANSNYLIVAERVSELSIPLEQLKFARGLGDRAFEQLLADALLGKQLTDKLNALPLKSYDEMVAAELAKQEAGNFDGRRLFLDMALGKSNLLLNGPIILPDFQTLGQDNGKWPYPGAKRQVGRPTYHAQIRRRKPRSLREVQQYFRA